MRFVLRRYWHLLKMSLLKRGAVEPLHRRKVSFCLTFLVVFPLLELLNAACLLLDNLLFWKWRRAPIRRPVFVIGNPRSGTTLIHRLLAGDEEHFFCFTSWQIFFPSVLQKLLLAGLGRIDRACGGPLRRLIERRERRQFQEFSRYHQLGMFLPEEDDKVLVHILAAADLAYFFPYADFQRFAQMDLEVDAAEQSHTMEFYARCVRRQAFFHGGQRSLVSKNPLFTGKIENLLRHFPDGKIICMVRNPLDVVASTISMMRAIIRLSFGTETGPDLDRTVYEMLKFFYLYPLERLSRLPADRWLFVKYDDLLQNPQEVIRAVYERLGLPLTPSFERRLAEETVKIREHKSRHSYSLADQSIPPEQIVSELWPVFERFGFDTRGISVPRPSGQAASDMPLWRVEPAAHSERAHQES